VTHAGVTHENKNGEEEFIFEMTLKPTFATESSSDQALILLVDNTSLMIALRV
jgi:hypothetical protein